VHLAISKKLLEHTDMFKRSALSSAIVLAGSVWGSAALANVESGAQFSSAADITKVSEWMGKDVHDNEGNEIGEISDFALNLEDGSIVYAVVDLGGMFSTKAIAVPVSSLSSSPDNDDELTCRFPIRSGRVPKHSRAVIGR
jgi:sporulation protein YlmC with PRC-barrel domain